LKFIFIFIQIQMLDKHLQKKEQNISFKLNSFKFYFDQLLLIFNNEKLFISDIILRSVINMEASFHNKQHNWTEHLSFELFNCLATLAHVTRITNMLPKTNLLVPNPFLSYSFVLQSLILPWLAKLYFELSNILE